MFHGAFAGWATFMLVCGMCYVYAYAPFDFEHCLSMIVHVGHVYG
jgi:hypothetical protein